jgi:predicted nuclease of predicted toxin-antitoxin system
MSKLRFYTDTHVDKQVAIQLRLQGIEVVRCQEIGMANAEDENHLIYAVENGFALITKDADFRDLHYHWLNEEKSHCGIFYCSDRRISAVGHIVSACTTYYQLLMDGAGTLADINNHFFEIC